MTNTTESLAPVILPSDIDYRASGAAFLEHARIKAALIMAARPMTPVLCRDHPDLIVTRRTWPHRSHEAFAAAAALEAGNIDRFLELMGAPATVQLSADGRAFDTTRWCRCDGVEQSEWVYVETWDPRGLVSHGWMHAGCRYWLQTG